jgi:hypothetical protein
MHHRHQSFGRLSDPCFPHPFGETLADARALVKHYRALTLRAEARLRELERAELARRQATAAGLTVD